MVGKRIVFVFFLFIMAVALVSAVSADDSADLVNGSSDMGGSQGMDENNDSSQDSVSWQFMSQGTFTELQDEIDKAEEGSTIYLDKNYYPDYNYTGNGIRIDKPITIEGNGHKISGFQQFQLLLIENTRMVMLKDITFTDGVGEYGSISILQSDNVTFYFCSFSDNQAKYGGAVYSDHCNDLYFDICFFSMNRAEYGGAVYLNNCIRPTFYSGRFFMNRAEYGGAVYLNRCIRPIFYLCGFSSNVASRLGGAAYLNHCEKPSFSLCMFMANSPKSNPVYLSHCNGYSFSNCVADGESYPPKEPRRDSAITTTDDSRNNIPHYIHYASMAYRANSPSVMESHDNASSGSKGISVDAVPPYDFITVPILIFSSFLAILLAIFARNKIKSRL